MVEQNPPASEQAEAPAVRAPVTRAPVPPARSQYPEPVLTGDPDASPGANPVASGTGCCAPPPVARPEGPLPPPRILMRPPVRVARTDVARRPATPAARPARPARRAQDGQRATVSRATRAAEQGAWGEVLRLSGDAPTNVELLSLRNQAHAWAHAQLRLAVDAVALMRFQEGLDAVKAVLVEMQGHPEAIDAERGVMAIRTLLELRYLDPEGEVAKVVRQNAFEELRGTRWAILFS